jgi:hypothetical protein
VASTRESLQFQKRSIRQKSNPAQQLGSFFTDD